MVGPIGRVPGTFSIHRREDYPPRVYIHAVHGREKVSRQQEPIKSTNVAFHAREKVSRPQEPTTESTHKHCTCTQGKHLQQEVVRLSQPALQPALLLNNTSGTTNSKIPIIQKGRTFPMGFLSRRLPGRTTYSYIPGYDIIRTKTV